MKRYMLNFRTTYQLVFAFLIVVALVSQFIYGGFAVGFTIPYIGLFISYFTILSNILVAIVLVGEAQASLQRKPLSTKFDWVRGFAIFCILTTGIVYTFFLRGPGGTMIQINDALPWANLIFHRIMPVAVALDWIFFPPKRVVYWRNVIYWLFLTAAYALYVEALGLVSKVYPYFFLDPGRLHGYGGVLRACIAFIPFLLVIGGIIVLANKIRRRFKKSRR